MRKISIDLSSDNHLQQPKIFGGYAGEHNETVLQVKLPKRMIDIECSGYRFDFQTSEDNLISSPLIPVSDLMNDVLSFHLTEQFTIAGNLLFKIVAISSDANNVSLISKSNTVVIRIEDSPNGNIQLIDPNGYKDELQKMVDERIAEVNPELSEVIDAADRAEAAAQSVEGVGELCEETKGVAEQALEAATLAKRYAVGGTNTEEDEDSNNARYYCETASSLAQISTEEAVKAEESRKKAEEAASAATSAASWTLEYLSDAEAAASRAESAAEQANIDCENTVKKQGEKGGTIDILPELESENKLEFKVITEIKNGTVNYKDADNYKTTPIIELKKGQSIRFYAGSYKFRKLVEFTANDVNAAVEGSIRENFSDFTIEATDGNKYVQVSFWVDDSTRNIYVETQSSIEIEYGVSLNNEQIAQVKKAIIGEYEYKNMLTGKKWVAFGDSLTEGSEEYGTFEDGLYKGENMVYPFFVGRRCGMNVVNLASSGSTLARCDDRFVGNTTTVRTDYLSHESKCKSAELEDADYITIKIGTNDDNLHYHRDAENEEDRGVVIGDVDSDDNSTFNGAWNTVLSHLTSTYPTKHIGIIISNVATLDYVNATIAMAKRWGIPYLNMALDPQLPLAYRSIRTDVQDSVKNKRNAAFKVNIENDSHPNADWHEFESHMIESWLMTI